jgi:inner membrane protein
VFVLIAVLPFFIWMHSRAPALAPLAGSPSATGAFCQNVVFTSQAGKNALCPDETYATPSRAKTNPFWEMLAGGQRYSVGAISLVGMYLMALAGVCTHIYLDSMTTFGTQVFLPFSSYRVAIPAMFIVDPLLTIPALILMIMAWRQQPDIAPYRLSSLDPDSGDQRYGVAVFSARARKLAIMGLAWILIYPLIALGVNVAATAWVNGKRADGHKIHLLTEPFGPLVWKAVVDEGDQYGMFTLNLLRPNSPKVVERMSKPDWALYAELERQSPLFRKFRSFCSYMAQGEREVDGLARQQFGRPVREVFFVDMRYLMSPQGAATIIGRTDPNFVLEARVDDAGRLLAYRFLQRGKDMDKPWTEKQ